MDKTVTDEDMDFLLWSIGVQLAISGGVILTVGIAIGIAIGAWVF